MKSRYLFNKRLIAEVRKRPCLWHRDHGNSVTSASRFGVKGSLERWDELGAVFGLSGEVARKRWRQHRDTFTKKWRALFGKRKVDIETARALPADKQWPHFQELLFLFEKDPLLEFGDEEMTDSSTNGDTVTSLLMETTNDTTCSGDSESAEQTEPSDPFQPPGAVEASDAEACDAVEPLAEAVNDSNTNSEPPADNTNNGGTISSDAVEPSTGEDAIVCTSDNAGSLILLQSPIENTVMPTITWGPEIDWSRSGFKGRRILPKGLVVSDVRSVGDGSSSSQLTNGPSLPVNGLPLPVIRLSLPANGTSVPVNGLSLPVIRLSMPANGPSMLANGPTLPVNGPSLPVDVSSIPVNESSIPVNGSSMPINGSSLPINRPSLPINGPSLPVHRPLPQTAKAAKSSASEADEPAIGSSSTAPDEMDHISHFLYSLERYVRKTADASQPQLMMELLNVASSYSEGLYPVLLFPRT